MSAETMRRVEGFRLAYYGSRADADFWDAYWQGHLSSASYTKAEHGHLYWFEEPFTRHLPKQGRILEAGCGLGKFVLALRVLGYEAEGVEWGSETVEAVRTLFPDFPIRTGDVTQLEVPDGYYKGYISLGVVEHRREGPEPFLQEAYRVLEPGGVALISVPNFHPLRRLKAQLGFYQGKPGELDFYQYAYTEAEFITFLRLAGFRIVDEMNYAVFKGLKDEIPLLHVMSTWRGVGWRMRRLISRWRWAEQNLGHMILFVCRKESV